MWRRKRGDTHSDLVKLAKVECAIAVDGRSDVLAVFTVFDQFQLSDTANVRESGLDLRHVQDLEGGVQYGVEITIIQG